MTRSLAALLLGALLCVSGVARADVAACVAAAERGQVERDARKLTEARASFVACADATCPEVVRKECMSWLAEVEARLPTVVILVRNPKGEDVPDAQVLLDGEEIERGALGLELPVNPGTHVVTARHGGHEVEAKVVASERSKGRQVTLTVGEAEEPAPAVPAPQPAPLPEKRSWVGPAITLSAGALLLGTSGILTLTARNEADDLRKQCAPNCAASEVDALDTRLVTADVLFGVGTAAAVAGVVWWLWPTQRNKQRGALRVAPVARGLLLEGAF